MRNATKSVSNIMQDVAQLYLFTDGSVNTQTKTGWGASLILAEAELEFPPETLTEMVQLKRFAETASSKLELQTLIWSLSELSFYRGKITVYTDSQTIIGLPGRRKRLEKMNYFSRSGKRINNHELYREFYSLTDVLDCTFCKIKGHQPAKRKNNVERIFTVVDRTARKAVRNETGS